MTLYLTLALAFFNMTGVRASRVLGVLYAIKLDAQPFTIGALAATFALFPLLLSWPAGRIVDRYGPRMPLLLGALGSGIGMLLPCFWPALTAVFIAAAMSGIATTFYSIALQNMVGAFSTVATARAITAIMRWRFRRSGVRAALAGFSFDLVGRQSRCDRGGVFCRACSHAARGADPPRAKPSTAPPMNVKSVLTNSVCDCAGREQPRAIRARHFLFYVPVYGAGTDCRRGNRRRDRNVRDRRFAARVILPSWIARFSEERVLGQALVLSGISLVLVPFFTTAVALSVIGFVFGFGLNVTQPISLIIMYARSPEGRSGEALGVRFAADNATKLVGPIVFGAIAAAVGVAAVCQARSVSGGVLMRRGQDSKGRKRDEEGYEVRVQE